MIASRRNPLSRRLLGQSFLSGYDLSSLNIWDMDLFRPQAVTFGSAAPVTPVTSFS